MQLRKLMLGLAFPPEYELSLAEPSLNTNHLLVKRWW